MYFGKKKKTNMKNNIVKFRKNPIYEEFDEIIPISINGKPSKNLFEAVQGKERYIVLLNQDNLKFIGYSPICNISYSDEECIILSIFTKKYGEKYALIRTSDLYQLTEHIYDEIIKIDSEFFLTRIYNYYGIIDRNGNIILPNNFSKVSYNSKTKSFKVRL